MYNKLRRATEREGTRLSKEGKKLWHDMRQVQIMLNKNKISHQKVTGMVKKLSAIKGKKFQEQIEHYDIDKDRFVKGTMKGAKRDKNLIHPSIREFKSAEQAKVEARDIERRASDNLFTEINKQFAYKEYEMWGNYGLYFEQLNVMYFPDKHVWVDTLTEEGIADGEVKRRVSMLKNAHEKWLEEQRKTEYLHNTTFDKADMLRVEIINYFEGANAGIDKEIRDQVNEKLIDMTADQIMDLADTLAEDDITTVPDDYDSKDKLLSTLKALRAGFDYIAIENSRYDTTEFGQA